MTYLVNGRAVWEEVDAAIARTRQRYIEALAGALILPALRRASAPVRVSRVKAWAPGRAALLTCGCSLLRPFTSRPAAVAHVCSNGDHHQ